MGSFRCYDSSNVIATLMMTNFHLNTTVVAILPNDCLWRSSLCSDLVLTLKNRIEPSSYARMAYVVAIWPSFLFDSFVKIWATCEIFLGKWFTAPLAKNFPYAYVNRNDLAFISWIRGSNIENSCICHFIFIFSRYNTNKINDQLPVTWLADANWLEPCIGIAVRVNPGKPRILFRLF